ncbi:tryptophanyl-tRNA synthetase [Staphylotrichum tortipilum]|uniref:tryptophan--tRNA ligase n=1 Tax=Staphylotrichum tortipilum TaxID=2831512 RepID=A0AAN6RWL1_9PEZI|nr:tryptophanyl-tRNA synthetase [Staphylotrichum longicolle]
MRDIQAPGATALDENINLWSVTGEVGENGTVKPIDYNKLVDQFGTKLIDDVLLARFERVTGHTLHRFLRRGIVFSHRDLELLTKWHSDVFEVPLVIMLTDEGKYFIGNVDRTVDKYEYFAREKAKDIVAVGFDPDKTFIFSDYGFMGGDFYKNITRVAKIHFAAVQAASSLATSFPFLFGPNTAQTAKIPCLIPCAVDQDPHFRFTQVVEAQLGYAKPSLIHPRFLDALQGPGSKMSASVESSSILVRDSPKQIFTKIKQYAFSGGRETLEEHRAKGALARICREYKAGNITTGEIKQKCIDELSKFCTSFQERRAKVKNEMLDRFMTPRSLL